VVVLDPRRETAVLYRPDSPPQWLTADAELSVPEVVPGWSMRVADLFR
jgi:Uma2 family endonuclease